MRQTVGEASSWAAAIEQAESGGVGMASGPLDIHNALVAAAEEMKFDLPEFLPFNKVRAVATELSFGFLVLLGLVLFGWACLSSHTFLT